MTSEQIIKKILERIERLEKVVFNTSDVFIPKNIKIQTLPELVRNKMLKNGQQKIAVIVGYYEKIQKIQNITKKNIRQGWKDAKFNGSYTDTLLQRAIRDGLVRNLKDDSYDLTQSGETFFSNFLNLNDEKG